MCPWESAMAVCEEGLYVTISGQRLAKVDGRLRLEFGRSMPGNNSILAGYVANPLAKIEAGQMVAVEVHSLGLWSVNLSQIVAKIQTERRFGFIYKTHGRMWKRVRNGLK
jgi:hypothetical protein